jgi:arylsulfatase A-like enzyme
MKPTAAVVAFLLLVVAATGPAAPAAQANPHGKKPNIIVIFTDDQGYADLSCVGSEKDVKTPNIDRLATEGVRFTDGYVTAPQCCPSRAGLLTGRDQNRFGLGSNGQGPLPREEVTIADRLSTAGYVTGMIGKWHLDPNHSDAGFIERHQIEGSRIPPPLAAPYHPHARGFQETFCGQLTGYSATYDLEGKRFKQPRQVRTEGDRLDRQSDAAVRFIELHHDSPFFLYLAYYAPHVPLESSKKYLDRFPGPMPERRRLALAMISAMDDGVGRIMNKLDEHGLAENTLVCFISDNGAPLKLTMPDDPLDKQGPEWDGSKNTPLNGEKGMLSEGGIRVPYIVRWKGTIPSGKVDATPVSTLDVAATACTLAGLPRPRELDGLDLMPMLVDGEPLPDRVLHWRFWNQTAARQGPWKLLKLGNRKTFLFHVATDIEERHDVSAKHPEIVQRLEGDLTAWATLLEPPGIPTGDGNAQEKKIYERYFNLPAP